MEEKVQDTRTVSLGVKLRPSEFEVIEVVVSNTSGSEFTQLIAEVQAALDEAINAAKTSYKKQKEAYQASTSTVKKPATPKQLELIRSLDPEANTEGLTQEEASNLIDKLLKMRYQQKKK